MQRKLALAGWATAAVLVTVIGAAGVLWQWRRADRHPAQERRERGRLEAADIRRELEQAGTLLFSGVRPAQAEPPERTLALAEQAVRLDPTDRRRFRLLGMAPNRAGQFAAAAEAFQAEGRLCRAEYSPHTLFYLAPTHHQLGLSNQATACFRQAEQWWKLLCPAMPPTKSSFSISCNLAPTSA